MARSVSASTSMTSIAMITVPEVLNRLFDVLNGTLPIGDFNRWIAGASWDMHRDSDKAAIDLVGDLELSLAEYTSDHLSKADLLQRFNDAASNIVVDFEEAPGICMTVAESTSSNVFFGGAIQTFPGRPVELNSARSRSRAVDQPTEYRERLLA